jgi:hypothetical protein
MALLRPDIIVTEWNSSDSDKRNHTKSSFAYHTSQKYSMGHGTGLPHCFNSSYLARRIYNRFFQLNFPLYKLVRRGNKYLELLINVRPRHSTMCLERQDLKGFAQEQHCQALWHCCCHNIATRSRLANMPRQVLNIPPVPVAFFSIVWLKVWPWVRRAECLRGGVTNCANLAVSVMLRVRYTQSQRIFIHQIRPGARPLIGLKNRVSLLGVGVRF